MRNRYAVPQAISCMHFKHCCIMPTLTALCIPGTTSAAFDSPADQRLHFKSDWHRFNVKLRSVGKATVDEAEFERLVSNKDEASTLHGATMVKLTAEAAYTDASVPIQVSSISGSDTDSDDEATTSGQGTTQKTSQLMFKNQGRLVHLVLTI